MRIVHRLVLFASAFAMLYCPAARGARRQEQLSAQQVSAIDTFVAGQMAAHRIPGVAVGIYSRGTILMAKGFGLANVELHVPVTPKTMFESGSVGKQFVATAVMMLAQEGKLSLDDSITKYFPNAPASWKGIRIENLLSHTSGIPDFTRKQTGPGGPFYSHLNLTEDQLAKRIEALPLAFAPGTKWEYSNPNYVLLGILIHRVTGMPYWKFLKERIFDPLGMTSSRVINLRDIIPNRASGYVIDKKGQLKNAGWVSQTFDSTADGSLYLNVLDMAKWDAALYGTRLLSRASLDKMWTVYRLKDGQPNSGDYGFGWWMKKENGHRMIEHNGGWQGFSCDISRYPGQGITVMVFTNLDGGHSDPWTIAHRVAGIADPALRVAKKSGVHRGGS